MKQARRAGFGKVGLLALMLGCSYAVGDGSKPKSPASAGHDQQSMAVDDGARCDFKGRDDREVAESVGTGALQPSIRRVYRIVGRPAEDIAVGTAAGTAVGTAADTAADTAAGTAGQGSARRIIACREVDTNLDGKKDVVRRYNDQGEPIEERADTNFDGALDRMTRFSRGKVALIQIDENQDDKPEETRYYQNGKLSRVQRDTNADGKPDIWEIYAGGHLERMGVDVDFDGRVDRWNRDEVTLRAQRAAEEAAEEKEKAAEQPPRGQHPEAAEAAEPHPHSPKDE